MSGHRPRDGSAARLSDVPTRARVRYAALLFAALASALLMAGCIPPPAPSPLTGIESPGPTAPAAPSRSPSRPSLSPSANTPPPLNRLELKVIDALARLGIAGRRNQLPYEEASVSAQVTTGLLFVFAWPPTMSTGDFAVVDERQIEGRRVQIIEYTGGPPTHRFECSRDTYHVWGAVPPAFQGMDAFVTRLIRALGCGAQ